jgi:hypothetical protein
MKNDKLRIQISMLTVNLILMCGNENRPIGNYLYVPAPQKRIQPCDSVTFLLISLHEITDLSCFPSLYFSVKLNAFQGLVFFFRWDLLSVV